MLLPLPNEIKLVITDVDGTLLTSQHQLHPKTLVAFNKLRAAQPDLPIVIASGKQYNSCLWIRNELGLPAHFPSAHCNGAIIYGGKSGGLLHQSGLTPKVVKYIVEGTQRFGTFIFTEDAAILVTQGEGVHRKDWCGIASRYDKGVKDCSHEPDRSRVLQQVANGELVIPKVTICVDECDLHAAKLCLDALSLNSPLPFKITRAIPFIFEAISPEVHKGAALSQICESLGNVLPEQVLAFGDGENDVDMFHAAGYPVAMGNAMPAALAAARYTTTTNDDGGVGDFIDKVWGI